MAQKRKRLKNLTRSFSSPMTQGDSQQSTREGISSSDSQETSSRSGLRSRSTNETTTRTSSSTKRKATKSTGRPSATKVTVQSTPIRRSSRSQEADPSGDTSTLEPEGIDPTALFSGIERTITHKRTRKRKKTTPPSKMSSPKAPPLPLANGGHIRSVGFDEESPTGVMAMFGPGSRVRKKPAAKMSSKQPEANTAPIAGATSAGKSAARSQAKSTTTIAHADADLEGKYYFFSVMDQQRNELQPQIEKYLFEKKVGAEVACFPSGHPVYRIPADQVTKLEGVPQDIGCAGAGYGVPLKCKYGGHLVHEFVHAQMEYWVEEYLGEWKPVTVTRGGPKVPKKGKMP